MAKPDPQGGLVIRYDYLWHSEEQEGREDGAKVRPCAVVVALPPPAEGTQQAVVCAVTHTRPHPPIDAVELPPKVKRHLGLDAERSWVIVSEANLVDWDDPGIEPVGPNQWSHGFVPPTLADILRNKLLRHYRAGKLPLVNRPMIESKRAQRER